MNDYLRPDDYTEAPDGVDCPNCDGSGDIDLGDGPYGQPRIYACHRCYGTGRVPAPEDPRDAKVRRLLDLLEAHLPTDQPWSEEAWGLIEDIANAVPA